MKLTPEQESELRRLKSYFPFRIIWCEVDKAGKFSAQASRDKRQLNKSVRAGNQVAILQ